MKFAVGLLVVLIAVQGVVSGQEIDDCGLLLDGALAGCVFFRSDNFGSYVVDDLQGHETGDYVHIYGTIDTGCPDECNQGQGCLTDYTITDCLTEYICGDANASGFVDLDDAVYLITYIFGAGPEPVPYVAGDCNCSANVDLDDVVFIITYIFGAGPIPCDISPVHGDGVPDC
jgi:hypothetical protein